MRDLRHFAFKAGFETLYFSGAYKAMWPMVSGVGLIFMLHHVRPEKERAFAPNRLLEVTPEYLDQVLSKVRKRGYDIISMDEVHARLTSGEPTKPFAVFTFDDGYRDNAEYAYPVLKKHDAPFCVYIATTFADHCGELWWEVLEEVIRRQDVISAVIDGKAVRFTCASASEKYETFKQIYWWMRSIPESEMRVFIRDLGMRYGADCDEICSRLCMTWDEIRTLAQDPLVTIGAHSVHHYMLRKYPANTARAEISHCRSVIEAELDRQIKHFAYPVGDPTSAGPEEFAMTRDMGFLTAVTTRPGMIFSEHKHHLTALPRVSLNGYFQNKRYIDVLLSGAPFALLNQFRKVNAA